MGIAARGTNGWGASIRSSKNPLGNQLQFRSVCGRYRLSRRKEILAEHFGADVSGLEWEPRYNIAPTQPVPVIRRSGSGLTWKASTVRWGLIPSWASDPAVGARAINARSETAASKPSFREPLQNRRCLIPADGFYEWQRAEKMKQPFCFEVGDGALFAFAGLWDRWRSPDGGVLETCAILTTTANELLTGIHDRMPVIIEARHYDRWLDPTVLDAPSLLKPFNAGLMRSYPVSPRVNVVANDGPECSMPVEQPAKTPTLFD